MSANKIRAGKGEVELSIRDKFDRGLAVGRQKLQAFASFVTKIGTTIQVAGFGILGALGGLTAKATSAAGQLQDLSDSTGISAELLSALDYAGAQAGVSLQSLAGGLKGMAKFTLQLQSGSKAAQDVLSDLGISAAAFMAASPEGRLGLVADGLQKIQDPSIRAGLAMKVLGRSAFDMQRMLKGGSAGLNKMLQDAYAFGAVASSQEIQLLDDVGDGYTGLLSILKGFAMHVAAALAPALLMIIDRVKSFLGMVNQFVVNNQELVRWIALVGIGLIALGGAFLAAAGVATVLGMVLGAVSQICTAAVATFVAAKAALLFMISPMGLLLIGLLAIAAATIAGAYYFLRYTQVGQQMCAALVSGLGQLWSIASNTFGGILDYLIAGKWQSAGMAAMMGLQVAWLTGVGWLKNIWATFTHGIEWMLLATMRNVLGIIKSAIGGAVGAINSVRKKLGLKPMTGGAIAGALDAVDRGLAKRQQDSAAALAQKYADNGKAAADAQKLLEAMRADARTAREATMSKFKGAITSPGDSGLGGDGGRGGLTGSLGTFSGWVAQHLGRSAPDMKDAKVTAKNTGRMADTLDDIRDEIEDAQGGVVFQ